MSIGTADIEADDRSGTGDQLDGVWKALANADRRAILDLLRDAADRGAAGGSDPETGGGLPTGDVVMALPHVSRFAVMQQLKVLQQAGLVTSVKRGRLVLNYLNAVPIQMIYERWVTAYEGHWASSLLSLKGRLEGDSSAGGRESGAADAGRLGAGPSDDDDGTGTRGGRL